MTILHVCDMYYVILIFDILSVFFFFFFFQAEDGIRDWSVTGVQTCALPISGSPRARRSRKTSSRRSCTTSRSPCSNRTLRSEERRVGKECRCRWTQEHEKKKEKSKKKEEK